MIRSYLQGFSRNRATYWHLNVACRFSRRLYTVTHQAQPQAITLEGAEELKRIRNIGIIAHIDAVSEFKSVEKT